MRLPASLLWPTAVAVSLIAAAALFHGEARAQVTDAASVNSSVVIATGNTFQSILPALGAPPATRRSLTIQNNNTTTDNCWITYGTIAGVPVTAQNATKGTSILLTPAQGWTRYYPYIPSDQIFGTCATSADTLYVDTQ